MSVLKRIGSTRLRMGEGKSIKVIHVYDPAGIEYTFMTSEMTLPPGLIAFLYKLRWDIEKIFDEKKNKLQKKKAWARSLNARNQQALFVCLAHNLLVLFERCLDREEGIRDQKVHAKRKKRAQISEAWIREQGAQPNPLVQQCCRPTQRSLQFIRWLRHCLEIPTSW